MFRNLSFLMIAILFSCMMTGMQVNAQELLANPGFEDWDSGVPLGWDIEVDVTVTEEDGEIYEGDLSVSLEATSSSNRGIFQEIPVVPGNVYVFSAYLYGLNGNNDLGLYVNWLDSSGGNISGEGTFYNSAANAWELVTTGEITPPANAAIARCRIRCYANSLLGGYADSASFINLGGGPSPTPFTPSPTPTGPTPTPGPVEAIKINEIYINPPGTDMGCYVELYFPGGISLDGYSLVGVNGNGGSDYQQVDLSGYAIPADGFFVLAQDSSVAEADLVDTNANYQNGPDSIQLRHGSDVVDAIGYGDFASAVFAGEGDPAPAYFTGEHSHSRYPDGQDSDNNMNDFTSGELTAGSANIPESAQPTNTATASPTPTPTGPTPTPPPILPIKINEVHVNPDGQDLGCFVELYLADSVRGNIDGYSLVGVNGFDGSEYAVIPLSGDIPANGFFVIAQDASVANADIINDLANFQNGPDNIELRAGHVVVDAIGYGNFLETEIFTGEGNPVSYPNPTGNLTLSRIPDGTDTDDNSVDFINGEITAGEANVAAGSPTATPSTPTNTPTPTHTPTMTPTGADTFTPTPTPTGAETNTPTPTTVPTDTPEPTSSPTPPLCDTLGVKIIMPSMDYGPGDDCYCKVQVCNPDDVTYQDVPLFVLLNVFDTFYFAPAFNNYDKYEITTLAPYDFFEQDVLELFQWPEGAGNVAQGVSWIAAMTNTEITDLLGDLDTFEFGWHE